MKKTIPLIITILFQSLTLFGDVKFNFIYTDEPETGFHAKPEAKTALEEVGKLIGCNWLKQHDANIVIKVSSEEDPDGIFLASAKSVDYSDLDKDEFSHTSLGKKIILNQNNEDKEFDAIINVNFHYNWSFGDIINLDQYDFKSALIHEITHTLGFTSKSSCPKTITELLEDNLDDFTEKLFIYGINEIQKNPQDIDLDFLTERLNLFQSNEIDIDQYILKEAASPIERLIAELTLEFKNSIISKGNILPFNSSLFDQLINFLVQKGKTIQNFIELDQEMQELASELISLGMQIISINSTKIYTSKIDFIKIKQNFIDLDLLHGDLNNYLNNVIASIIDENPTMKSLILLMKELILVTNEYIAHNTLNLIRIQYCNELKEEIINSLGMNDQDILNMLQAINASKNKFSFLDQFITDKNGEIIFDKNYKEKITNKCLLSDEDENKQIFFNGPKTLKFLGSPIPLDYIDGAHISSKRESIMTPSTITGPDFREWDNATTAIMLDLGYKVDNYWTRLWADHEIFSKEDL